MRLASISSAVAVTLALTGCPGSSTDGENVIESHLTTQVTQIGGASSAIARYVDAANGEWALYSMANRFAATPVGTSKGAVSEITVPGYIQHITQVTYNDTPYALLSMGGKGIAVVDISNPSNMVLLTVVNVNYEQTGLTWVDGGGTPVVNATISGKAGTVNDVVTDGTTLWIGDASYGIHQTALSNLLPVPVTEADGTLKIDKEIFTLQYAGENPWGGPQSLKLHNGKIYASLGFLGIGVYTPVAPADVADPAMQIVRDGGYNLYTDEAQNEDWFGSRKLSLSVQDPAWLDPVTGMPTWQQAQYEIDEIWRNKAPCAKVWCTPWASFDRYGKYYYNARTMDLVDLPGGKTMAYIAYSLGGLVAVDVTDTAAPVYQGYIAAAPAHGPDEPTGQQSKSIFPHFGSGMLKEAGVMDVRVAGNAVDGYKAYYSDHFAGLVVASDADSPATKWKAAGAPFNNDTDPQEFWPDYEFVTSYDMTPVPVGDESMPKFLTFPYAPPLNLVTGEISGHGGPLFLMSGMNTSAAGQVDLVQATGAGGVNFIDIKDFNGATLADRFEVPVHHVSTKEVGAAANGSASQLISIGHAEGITVAGNFAYLADGPHGVSVWRIAEGAGAPIDTLHLVANTLQSEYPTDGILPTPHAFKVAIGSNPSQAFVLTQSLGLRRVDISAVTGGTAQVGAPALLAPQASDIFEHSTESGGNLGGIKSQDHAYGTVFSGKYAVVADGGNGLTVYDLTVDPSTGTGAHIVANIGGSDKSKPILGRSAAVKLWTNPATHRKYAIVAAGSYGISVVDMTDLLDHGITPGMTLIKTFEPKKYDEDKVGSADGKSVDVHVVGDYAYFSYDSFGLVAYKLTDLIQPVVDFQPVGQVAGACADVTDVTKLSAKQGRTVDCRPESVGRFKLQLEPGYETMDGGALYMTWQVIPGYLELRKGYVKPRLLFYVAYGDAGVVKLDWSDPANPVLLEHHDTVGSAAATAISNGRVYVADGTGGMVVFK